MPGSQLWRERDLPRGRILRGDPLAAGAGGRAFPAGFYSGGISAEGAAHDGPLDRLGRKPQLHFAQEWMGGERDADRNGANGRQHHECDRPFGALRGNGTHPVGPVAGTGRGVWSNGFAGYTAGWRSNAGFAKTVKLPAAMITPGDGLVVRDGKSLSHTAHGGRCSVKQYAVSRCGII